MLNNDLYFKLQTVFGKVRIAKDNSPAVFTVDDQGWGKLTQGGEEYRICCPFCGDTRFRLYLSYLYCSSVSRDGKDVRFGNGLAWCFNETKCMDSSENRQQLRDMLDMPEFALFGTTGTTEIKTVVYPKLLIPLLDLSKYHHAIEYLHSREIDIEYAASKNIAYCPFDMEMPLASDRLFIPVYTMDGQFIGGQFRQLNKSGDDITPKYWSLPHSRFNTTFYNIQSAVGKKLVVVTEGVFDALRVGDCGLATLTFGLSTAQEMLLGCFWPEIVFVLDSDIPKNKEHEKQLSRCKNKLLHASDRLRERGKKVTVIDYLEPGKDPADYSSEELFKIIEEARLNG